MEQLEIISEALDFDFKNNYNADQKRDGKVLAVIKVSEDKLKELSADKNIEIKIVEWL
ncbi:MAG: hypothetical protein LBS01_03560 [Prevotellaceae bacterium]|jgi:hypothetical protein|nr:hypothetical protein [Prevotellaceae bacterium]